MASRIRNPISALSHPDAVVSVALSPDGSRIVSGLWDGSIEVWDVETGASVRRLTGHRSWVTSVVVSPDSKHIISSSDDATIAVWKLELGKRIRRIGRHKHSVMSLALSRDGKLVSLGFLQRMITFSSRSAEATSSERGTSETGAISAPLPYRAPTTCEMRSYKPQ